MLCFGEKTKNCHCKIVFLDETELLQEIQSSTLGQDLLDVAFRHLNLLETAYFGLRFIDKTNQTHWLDSGKKVTQQLKGTDPFTFYFGVKFYASDPCKLLEEITRYQFFLQVKQDVLQERLPVPFELATELAAYAVQSELGDYDPRRHQIDYINEFKFITQQTSEFEARVCEHHKNFIGQVPAIAELNYLEKVKWLDMYGVDLHPVLGEDNVEYFLGLTPSGVIVLKNKSKVGYYFWPRITKVYFKGKYFMLRVRDKNNDESTYGFELPSKQACKHLWKCCVEHHSFFRLTQVCTTNSGKVFGTASQISRGRSAKGSHFPQQFGNHSGRMQPKVVRVASRRYQRRLGQPDGIDSSLKDEKENERLETRSNISIPQPVHLSKSMSVPALSDSPRSTRSAPWEDPRQRGLFSSSTNPSPRSVRSAGWKLPSNRSGHHRLRHRSPSCDSDDSCDSRRRRHSHSGHRHHRSRRNSDNESERSAGSKCSHSHHSHSRKHGERSSSCHHKESTSEVELSQKHRNHSDRFVRCSSNYELIDSTAQWNEVKKHKQEQQMYKSQSAVIRDLSVRKSGYTNSGMESEAEVNYMNRKRHRKHRSRSPQSESRHSKGPPPEIRKHIAYHLIDPTSMSDTQLKDIPYKNVETESKTFKVKYSPKSSIKNSRTALSRHSKSNAASDMKVCLQSDEDGESPPPPYSPPSNFDHQNRRSGAQGESDDSNDRRKASDHSSTRSNNGHMKSLYDLDLLSNHSKSNHTHNIGVNSTNNIPTTAAANMVSTSLMLNTTTAGGDKATNRKTNSTNNISNGEIGQRISINGKGMSNGSSNGLKNGYNSRFNGDLSNQSSIHSSTLDINRGLMNNNYSQRQSTSNLLDSANPNYNQQSNYNSGVSNFYHSGLPNFSHNSNSGENSILPPTALVPAAKSTSHFNNNGLPQINQFNQNNPRIQMYPNGNFDQQNSRTNHQSRIVTDIASQQQYYSQNYQSYAPNQHSTLPTRGSNANANGRNSYSQHIPNGYGHSSVGKAAAISNGFTNGNSNNRPQFTSNHMSAYHTRIFPTNSSSTWDGSQMNSSHLDINQQPTDISNSSTYSKLASESHHEMSTEL
ncbi:hypothetical protein CHUAL_011253 [Chamberlinius hualienensis]